MIYFDMDGVLAKWNREASIEDTHLPGYFLFRQIEEKVKTLIKILKQKGKNVSILSAAYSEGTALKDKKRWLTENDLGDIPALFVPYGTNKSEAVPEGTHILIDDFSKNLHEWESAGHIGIKFLNGINGTHGTWHGATISHEMDPELMCTMIELIEEKSKKRKRRKENAELVLFTSNDTLRKSGRLGTGA